MNHTQAPREDKLIGIYNSAERAAILAKYRAKRDRRNWSEEIKYECHKTFADSRKRSHNSRFVKQGEDITDGVSPLAVASQATGNVIEDMDTSIDQAETNSKMILVHTISDPSHLCLIDVSTLYN